jgi:hypothetical protein
MLQIYKNSTMNVTSDDVSELREENLRLKETDDCSTQKNKIK